MQIILIHKRKHANWPKLKIGGYNISSKATTVTSAALELMIEVV